MSSYQKAQNYNSPRRRIVTGIITFLLLVILFVFVNLHYRNYIDTNTTNAMNLNNPAINGAQATGRGSTGYVHDSWWDQQYRWLIEDVLKLDLNPQDRGNRLTFVEKSGKITLNNLIT